MKKGVGKVEMKDLNQKNLKYPKKMYGRYMAVLFQINSLALEFCNYCNLI